MSSAADHSASSNKRPAEEQAHGAEPAAQRARVEPETAPAIGPLENLEPEAEAEAAAAPAADAPEQAAANPFLAPAQRCAKDTLACVFSFLSLEELVFAIAVCWDWHNAAAKEKSRGLSLSTSRDMIIDLCSSRSPLRKHVTGLTGIMSLAILRALRELPTLTELGKWGLKEDECQIGDPSPYTAEELSEAFPPQLHRVDLRVALLGVDVMQVLLDALPSMPLLRTVRLTETIMFANRSLEINKLALEPLTRLPQLTELDIAGILSAQQLSVISQIGSLRRLVALDGFWNSSSLSALCHPANRLQQLEKLSMYHATPDAEHMDQLVRLPALTDFAPRVLTRDVYAYLPRFARLQHLVITLSHYDSPDLGVEQRDAMDSALRQCAELTTVAVRVIDRSFGGAALPDATGARLVRALPHLRRLALLAIRVPSLRFLQHAPQLEELQLIGCDQIRPVHLALLGQVVPRLTHLELSECADLRLGTWLLEWLTPPSRLLPLLKKFEYWDRRYYDGQPNASSEDEEEEEQPEADEGTQEAADEEDDGAVMDQDDGDEKEGAE